MLDLHASRFRPTVATWLNFAPDHLDVHRSLESYEAAKAHSSLEAAAPSSPMLLIPW